MAHVACAVLGLVLGGIVVWLVVASVYRSNYSAKLSEAERRANTAEGANAELHGQVEKAESRDGAERSRATLAGGEETPGGR